jgi:hypothetical protein
MFVEKIDFILIQLRNLEKMIVDVRNADAFPPMFFDRVENNVVEFLKQLYALKIESEAVKSGISDVSENQEVKPSKSKLQDSGSVPILNSKHASASFLNEAIEKQILRDIRRGFNLNDKFRFLHDLFGGDVEKMDKVLNELNELDSFEASVVYLNTGLNWNIEDPIVTGFINVLEKRFK